MDIQIGVLSSHLIHMGIAYLLALPIGWRQEIEERSAGLRTFPLVAVASSGYMLTGIYVFDSAEAQARIFYGIITGIGFIGGGSILKNKDEVVGTANAASIWTTGGIGIAVAWYRYEIALALCILNVFTLYIATYLKKRLINKEEKR